MGHKTAAPQAGRQRGREGAKKEGDGNDPGPRVGETSSLCCLSGFKDSRAACVPQVLIMRVPINLENAYWEGHIDPDSHQQNTSLMYLLPNTFKVRFRTTVYVGESKKNTPWARFDRDQLTYAKDLPGDTRYLWFSGKDGTWGASNAALCVARFIYHDYFYSWPPGKPFVIEL